MVTAADGDHLTGIQGAVAQKYDAEGNKQFDFEMIPMGAASAPVFAMAGTSYLFAYSGTRVRTAAT